MTRRPARPLLVCATALAVVCSSFLAALGSAVLTPLPAAADSVTTRTPVMGPNLLSASQLARWYHAEHGSPPKVPSLGNNITALAQTFIDEGRRDGVRGDIAFVQS